MYTTRTPGTRSQGSGGAATGVNVGAIDCTLPNITPATMFTPTSSGIGSKRLSRIPDAMSRRTTSKNRCDSATSGHAQGRIGLFGDQRVQHQAEFGGEVLRLLGGKPGIQQPRTHRLAALGRHPRSVIGTGRHGMSERWGFNSGRWSTA